MSLIPVNYQLLSISNNGNAFVYVRNDSTAVKPKELIVARDKANYVQNAQKFSVPQFSGNISVGTVAGDPQIPQPEKLSIKVIARVPVNTSQADIDTALSDFRAFVNSEDFASSIVTQFIPMCCDSDETGE